MLTTVQRNYGKLYQNFSDQMSYFIDNIVEFESRSGRVAQHNVIKFGSDIVAGRWVSSGTPVSSTNKTDRHVIAEILLKVALKNIATNHNPIYLLLINTC
jgi:hypothetical protein